MKEQTDDERCTALLGGRPMTDPPIVSRPASPEYRASWERIFGGAPDEPEPTAPDAEPESYRESPPDSQETPF